MIQKLHLFIMHIHVY